MSVSFALAPHTFMCYSSKCIYIYSPSLFTVFVFIEILQLRDLENHLRAFTNWLFESCQEWLLVMSHSFMFFLRWFSLCLSFAYCTWKKWRKLPCDWHHRQIVVTQRLGPQCLDPFGSVWPSNPFMFLLYWLSSFSLIILKTKRKAKSDCHSTFLRCVFPCGITSNLECVHNCSLYAAHLLTFSISSP